MKWPTPSNLLAALRNNRVLAVWATMAIGLALAILVLAFVYAFHLNPQCRQEQVHCFLGNSANDWVAIFTQLLAAGTILLAAFTGLLWSATFRAITLARKDAKAAREQSAKHAEQELRAYVNIASVRVTIDASSTNAVAKVLIRNFGKTPAYELQIVSKLEEMPLPLAEPALLSLQSQGSKLCLGPGAERTKVMQRLINLGRLKTSGASKATHALVFRGSIRYLDAFEKVRRTYFSYELSGAVLGQGKACKSGTRYRMVATNWGNDAD